MHLKMIARSKTDTLINESVLGKTTRDKNANEICIGIQILYSYTTPLCKNLFSLNYAGVNELYHNEKKQNTEPEAENIQKQIDMVREWLQE